MNQIASERHFSLGRWLAKLAGTGLALLLLVIFALRWLPPPTSAFMLRAVWIAQQEGRKDFTLRQQWVRLADIAPAAGQAVVASEDQWFFDHHGFDLDAIAQAFQRNQTSTRVRGGSTLSQQTAKNLFLYPERSFLRKGLEAGLTALLELIWSKARILEVYLNIAQFGDGIYGVEAAAQAFFGKSAKQLQPAEAALLAATLPNPIKLRADRPSGYVLKRRDWILQQMRQLGEAHFPRGWRER